MIPTFFFSEARLAEDEPGFRVDPAPDLLLIFPTTNEPYYQTQTSHIRQINKPGGDSDGKVKLVQAKRFGTLIFFKCMNRNKKI